MVAHKVVEKILREDDQRCYIEIKLDNASHGAFILCLETFWGG